MRPEFIAEPVRFVWRNGLLVCKTIYSGNVTGLYVMERHVAQDTLANLRDALVNEPVRQSAEVLPLPLKHR